MTDERTPEVSTSAVPAGDRPKKISEVRAWVAAHPDADPSGLAPYPKQRAAERRAALRALGAIRSPAALTVLSAYARENYPDTDLEELHAMWGNFDRRTFAATMFRPSAWRLNLGVARSLEGIGAIEGLTSLDVIFTGEADLTPLAECASLQRVKIISNVEPSVTSVDPLAHLPNLSSLQLSGVTRHADLAALADSPVRVLQISLDGADGEFLRRLPALRTLILSGGASAEESDDDEMQPIPAHPQLPEVVLDLVRSGVNVVVYAHERSWVSGLVATAEAADNVFVDEVAGRISLTIDSASRDRLRSGMRLNTITV